jgi:hypothetical protein
VYGVEGVRHVDGQDYPIGVILPCIHKALQAHANELGGTLHRYPTLSWLQCMELFLGLVKLKQAFAHHAAQCVTHGNGPHCAVFLL